MQRKRDDMPISRIEVIREPSKDSPFLIIKKPRGMASSPLFEGEKNCAVTLAVSLFPELQKVKGKKPYEYGLIHRLDTQASGLLLIAATDEAYAFFSEAQKKGDFIKTYRALCSDDEGNAVKLGGFPKPVSVRPLKAGDEFSASSYFRAYGKGRKSVRPVTENSNEAALKKKGSALYTTHIKIAERTTEGIIAQCSIAKGFRHQVRCHLAWNGLPVVGDELYNAGFGGEALEFECVALEFTNPVTGERVRVGTDFV